MEAITHVGAGGTGLGLQPGFVDTECFLIPPLTALWQSLQSLRAATMGRRGGVWALYCTDLELACTTGISILANYFYELIVKIYFFFHFSLLSDFFFHFY